MSASLLLRGEPFPDAAQMLLLAAGQVLLPVGGVRLLSGRGGVHSALRDGRV